MKREEAESKINFDVFSEEIKKKIKGEHPEYMEKLAEEEYNKKAGMHDGRNEVVAVEGSIRSILHGSVPALSYVNPLQTKYTGVGVRESNYNKPIKKKVLNQLHDVETNQILFKVDNHDMSAYTREPGSKPHINVSVPKNANTAQKNTAKILDHKIISDVSYKAFNDFDKVKKVAKNGGKAVAAVGVAMDAYELINTIYDDLNDEDRALGKETLKASASIGGSWIGGAAGAKVGAMGRASIGTVICPGLGTVIGGFVGGVYGGIVGSMGGRWLGEYVVENAYGRD